MTISRFFEHLKFEIQNQFHKILATFEPRGQIMVNHSVEPRCRLTNKASELIANQSYVVTMCQIADMSTSVQQTYMD